MYIYEPLPPPWRRRGCGYQMTTPHLMRRRLLALAPHIASPKSGKPARIPQLLCASSPEQSAEPCIGDQDNLDEGHRPYHPPAQPRCHSAMAPSRDGTWRTTGAARAKRLALVAAAPEAGQPSAAPPPGLLVTKMKHEDIVSSSNKMYHS